MTRKTIHARYSRVLGQFRTQSTAVDAIFKSLPNHIKGAGYRNLIAEPLRKQVREAGGISDGTLIGTLQSFTLRKFKGRRAAPRTYLKLGMDMEIEGLGGRTTPEPATVFLTLPLDTPEAVGILQRLVHARFGKPISLSISPEWTPSRKAGGAHYTHAVRISQNGKALLPDRHEIAESGALARVAPYIEVIQRNNDLYSLEKVPIDAINDYYDRFMAGNGHVEGSPDETNETDEDGSVVMPNEAEAQAGDLSRHATHDDREDLDVI
jgi:hypothetical protein